MHPVKCVILLIAIAVLCSCSAAGAGGGADKTFTFYSEQGLDGYIKEVSGEGTYYNGSKEGTSVGIGNDADSNPIRCFVSFDVSTLPLDAQIESAVLRMYQSGQTGLDSYSEPIGLGPVIVDTITYDSFTIGVDLFSGDTNGTDTTRIPLSSSYSANTWHELDVKVAATDEVYGNHTGRIQFRLRHHDWPDGTSPEQTDGWVMGDSATNRPELVIKLT